MVDKILSVKFVSNEEFIRKQAFILSAALLAYIITLNVGAFAHQLGYDIIQAKGIPEYQTSGGGLLGHLISSPFTSYQTSYFARLLAFMAIAPFIFLSIQLNAKMSEIKLPASVKVKTIKQGAYFAIGALFLKQVLNYQPVTLWFVLIFGTYLFSTFFLGFAKTVKE